MEFYFFVDEKKVLLGVCLFRGEKRLEIINKEF